MAANDERFLIICVGNEYRHDDGAGLAVARKLRAEKGLPVRVVEESGEGSALMEAWSGEQWVAIVDAVCSGADPGTIFQIDASEQPVPSSLFRYSTHAFGVAEAIELARTLHKLPSRLMVYGIEGGDFSQGIGLSPDVEEAIQHIVGLLVDHAREHAALSPA